MRNKPNVVRTSYIYHQDDVRRSLEYDKPINVPGLWFMSWYDVSVGPNLALYNHARKTADPQVADQQWAIIAPAAHIIN